LETSRGWQNLNTSSTSLYFSLKKSIANGQSDSNYYLYYGNQNTVGPTAKMIINDNFNDNSLDSNIWETNSGFGTISETSQQLQYTGRTSGNNGISAQVRTKTAVSGDFTFQTKIYIVNNTGSSFNGGIFLGSYDDTTPNNAQGVAVYFHNDNNMYIYSKTAGGGYTYLSLTRSYTKGQWYTIKIVRLGGAWYFYRDGILIGNYPNLYTGDVYFSSLRYWKESLGTNWQGDVYYDDFSFNSAVASGLTSSLGSETEVVSNTDASLKLTGLNEGSWAGYQLPSLPRNLRFAYGAATYVNNTLYVLRGYNTTTFYKLDLSTGIWTQLANTPGNMDRGSTLVWDGNDAIYASRGSRTTAFYKYTISTNTWSDTEATDPSLTFYYGAVGVKVGDYIYYVRGSDSTDFLRYDIINNSWSTLTSAPYGVSYGAGLAWDGGDAIWLYNGGSGLSKYSIANNSWAANSSIALMPYMDSDAYNGMVYDGSNYLYVFTYKNVGYSTDLREYVWRYDIANNVWEKVNTNLEYGSIVGAVAYDGSRYAYIIQGYASPDGGTRSLYRFDLQTKQFFPSTPPIGIDRYFIDTDGEYFYPQPREGTSLAYDGDDIIYYLMGNDDEFKFKKYVISQKKWYALPPIPCWYVGGGMAYAKGYLYAACGATTQYFFRYDAARENWEQLTNTPDTIGAAGNQGLVYDGDDALYLLRGVGSQTLYKYTISTNSWATESSTIPATIGNSYGASITYDGSGNLYVFRGNNTASFYKYNLTSKTWTTLTSAPLAAYYGSGSIYYNGRIYYYPGNQTTGFYVYDIASDTWLTGPSTPSEVYVGGAFVKGPGNTAYALAGYYDMVFWKFNLPSSSSSYVYKGTYTSKVFDLGNPYAFAGLEATVSSPSGTMVTFETRTSTDSASWSNWLEASDLKKISTTTFSYKINSTPQRYFQFRVTLESPESDSTPTISDVTVHYYSDTEAPTNPDTLTSYSNFGKSTEISNYTWYNFASPYFEWSGATDATGSGILGYYVYFGSDEEADASVSGTFQTAANYTASISSDGEYYLKIKTKDKAGNVSSQNWEAFHYRYDGTPPNAPSSASANPRTYTNTNSYTMFWLAVSDVTSNATSSGLLGYYYKTATASGELANYQLTTETQVANITAYQEGSNIFYVKARDKAGNDSEVVQVTYYYGGSAPSAPQNLEVTPASSTVNSFAFVWDAPASYQGSIAEYRYSVNSKPSATNYSSTTARMLSAGPYATVKGLNTFYVVAVDEAGNVNYDNYASVDFTADTSAPGIPQNLEAFDNSIRSTKQYKVGLTWDEPADPGSALAGYAIYGSKTATDCSSDMSGFTLAGTTAGTSYVVTTLGGSALESTTYYFCVKAYDSTNQYSAPSSTVSLLPTGRWLTAPDLTSNPSATVKTKSATITWSTSRTANSFVKYGTSSGSYGNEVGSSEQVTSHSIKLTGLTPGTKYYYKVLWTDEDGNQGSSSEYTFTTNPAPAISSVTISDISLYTAYVTFTIKNAIKATVQYGTTTNYGLSTSINVSKEENTQTVKLENLSDGTSYHLRILAEDDESNTFTSDDYTFETLPVPKISNLKIQQVIGLPTAALRLLWKTNSPTTTVVGYYPSSAEGSAKDYIKLSLSTDHEALIQNLLDNTEYVLVIKGKDKAGNETTPVTQKITTASDVRPPEIINLNTETTVIGIGEDAKAQIVVTWDTDEPATSQVEYGLGTGTSYAQATSEDSTLTSNHAVTITGLTTGQIYHLRVVSKDKAGNTAYSYDTVIVTPKATKDALSIVIDNLSKSFGFLKGIGSLKNK